MLLTKPYNRSHAVEYTRRWALSRNPFFADFTGIGGNCTNFVSQALLAGSCTMNYTPDYGWYYVSVDDRAPAWSSVEYLYDFLTQRPEFRAKNGGIGPFAVEVPRESVMIGDVVQLANSEGDWYHSLMVCGFRSGDILVCAQSDDALDRPLSTYRNAANFRFLHVNGVNIEINDDFCFEALLAGGLSEGASDEAE